MAIDRLSSTAALIAALRADGGRRSEAGRRRDKSADVAAGPASANGGVRDVAVLRRQLADLVRGEDIADPATANRLRPLVVRSLLLFEFGAQLREHPDWQPMLEGIVTALEADPGQQKVFAALLADLARFGSNAAK